MSEEDMDYSSDFKKAKSIQSSKKRKPRYRGRLEKEERLDVPSLGEDGSKYRSRRVSRVNPDRQKQKESDVREWKSREMPEEEPAREENRAKMKKSDETKE